MIYITGDIHGSLDSILELYEKYEPEEGDIIIILGDVGVNYTGRLRDTFIKEEMNNMGAVFFCIHGNHENRPQNIASYKEMEWNGGRVSRTFLK